MHLSHTITTSFPVSTHWSPSNSLPTHCFPEYYWVESKFDIQSFKSFFSTSSSTPHLQVLSDLRPLVSCQLPRTHAFLSIAVSCTPVCDVAHVFRRTVGIRPSQGIVGASCCWCRPQHGFRTRPASKEGQVCSWYCTRGWEVIFDLSLLVTICHFSSSSTCFILCCLFQ